VWPLDDGEDEQTDHRDRQDETERLDVMTRRILRGRHEPRTEQQGHGDDRYVDEEDRTPPEMFEEKSTGNGAERNGCTRHGRPHSDCLGPFHRIGEHVGDDRKRRGEHERRTDSHCAAPEDERTGRPGKRSERRTDREENETDLQGALPAEAITDAARCEKQAGKDEAVRVDDPLQGRRARVEFARQGGNRDVDDEVVDDDEEQRQTQDGKDEPATLMDAGVGNVHT
jgi:hypothetical protein